MQKMQLLDKKPNPETTIEGKQIKQKRQKFSNV